MSELIKKLAESEGNCYWGDYYDPSHKTEEIYTCLDCLEEDIRQAERSRIIKMLEEHADLRNAYYHEDYCRICKNFGGFGAALALIKGEQE